MKLTSQLILASVSVLLFGCGPYINTAELVPAASHQSDEVTAHIINVGSGSCQIIECAGQRSPLMVDCGTDLFAQRRGRDKVVAEVQDLLARHGNRVRLVVSQSSPGHVSLLDSVLQGVTVESIHYAGKRRLLPEVVREHVRLPAELSQSWEGWTFDASQPYEPLACGSGPTHVLSANAGFRHAPGDHKRHSMALLIEHEEQTLLLASDASGHAQDKIMQTLDTIKAPEQISALIAPNHGVTEDGSNDGAWGARINPAVVVYSAGRLAAGPSCQAVGVYKQLAASDAHPFRCVEAQLLGLRAMVASPQAGSEQGSNAVALSHRAQYATELNGSLRLRLDSEGVDVACHYQDEC